MAAEGREVSFRQRRELLEAWLKKRPSRLALVTLGRLRRTDVLGESPRRGASVRLPPGGTAARRQRARRARRASLPARLAERAGRGRGPADPVARAAPALPKPAAPAALRSLAGPRRVAVGASGRVAVGPSRPPAEAKAKAKAKAQRGRGRGRPFRPRLGSIREEGAEAAPAARRIRTPPALLAERWHAQSLARLRRAYRRHQGGGPGGGPRGANRPSPPAPAAVSWKNNLVMAR